MPIKTTRMLPCTLSKDECDERSAKASELDQEKRRLEGLKKIEMKLRGSVIKALDLEIAALTEAATKGEETREVECEERESLINGGTAIEVWRLDTAQLLETIAREPDEPAPDSRQPGLPFAAPPMPALPCTAIDDAGNEYGITAEQADTFAREMAGTPGMTALYMQIEGAERSIVKVERVAPAERRCSVVTADGECYPVTAAVAGDAEREILENQSARVAVHGKYGTGMVLAITVLRGKACDMCGIVNGHRPECAEMQREDEGGEDFREREAFEANDTAAIAARIGEVDGPSDASLVPPGADARPSVQVKPARKSKKNGKADGVEA